MACRDAYKTMMMAELTENVQLEPQTSEEIEPMIRLLFGVDSKVQANDVLQNNLTQFEWVTRNKLYPNFWGRHISGDNCLNQTEIDFLRNQGCKIAPIYRTTDSKTTVEQGLDEAKKASSYANELNIPMETAVFLEISEMETVTCDFLKGYALGIMNEGYTPGFKVNTDAKYDFDREYSRGLQTDRAVFEKCIVWAMSPSLEEYERVTTTHLIHPDNWVPHSPSGITRNEISLWQYGKECHPIYNDAGIETTFNINLVRNEQVIIEKMF